MLLMRQGEQAWLLAGREGNHEFARMYWYDDGKGPRYIVGIGGVGRLGPSELHHAAITDEGATLTWSCGRKTLIPLGWYQLTYRT